MFSATGHIWVDIDILLIGTFPPEILGTFLTRETQDSLCNAMMRLGPATFAVDRLIAEARAMSGRLLRWGETGPELLTPMVARGELEAQGSPSAHLLPRVLRRVLARGARGLR